MTRNKSTPPFVAQTLYDNFDEFIGHYERMNVWRRFDPLPIQALVRLARNDFPKAKRVYDWAVRVPMLRQLGGWYREFDKTKVTLSKNGLEQVELAGSRFGQNPAFALTMIEGIFILENTAQLAEHGLAKHSVALSLDELRSRPMDHEEEKGRKPPLHDLYDEIVERTAIDLRDYGQARNTAIMLGITGLADGCDPNEDEIRRVLRGILPSRQSAKKQRVALDERRSKTISDSRHTVEWVLGRDQREIPF